jgi:O-succinylbenzoic acid--CoA ligase
VFTAEDLVPGDLVAVPAAIGPLWLGLIREAWEARAALLPVDGRLSEPERGSLLERARPTVVVEGTRRSSRPRTGRPVSPETAFVFGTSGTAGVPKLVELSRDAVRYAVTASSTVLGATEDDVWLSCLPAAHVGGMLVLLRAVFLGTRIEVLERFDPSDVAKHRAQFVSLVPTMLARLLDAGADLSPYRGILIGGGAMRSELRTRAEAAGARIVQTYGLTETCGGVVYEGAPFPGTRVRIEGGLIELSGPSLMTAYLGDPAATSAAFTDDGWLRTGDAGRVDGRGMLRVLGRADELIDSGGEKVWPQEVEEALATHPAVADVAVGSRPDPEWGQRVVAFVVAADRSAPPTLEELRDHAASSIARFKAPRELVLLHALPRTASGKVRRAALSTAPGIGPG